MTINLPVYIGNEAISRLVRYCQNNRLDRFLLVADQNTYPALGRAVEEALKERGLDVKTVILTGDEVVANEHYLMQLFLNVDTIDRTYLAVGSGTITDITRFVSHRTKSAFMSVPTAPSVDGFTATGSPLVLDGMKRTIYTQPPMALFADLATLQAAPPAMIASGYGDMLGKFTSLADWRLGHLLWDEPYDDAIAQRAQSAVQTCASHAGEIAQASEEGIRILMDALVESGTCMLEFGSSHPASGMEHHMSHYWEMKLLWEGRPALLHGAKVGVAAIQVAKYYERIRQMTRQQVSERLSIATLPDREQMVARIRQVYAPIADQIIAQQSAFLDMTEQVYEQLKGRIIDCWDEVQLAAEAVPASQTLVQWMRQVGGPVDGNTLGLTSEEFSLAVENAHFVRNRFTVAKLRVILDLE